MKLQELFTPETILVDLEPRDKWDAIDRMMSHLSGVGRIDSEREEDLHESVLARERSMSTGMEKGIAIPHAAVDGLEEIVASLAIVGSEEGLSFESIDASPARFVVLLLIPRAQKLLHIRTLADVARVLGDDSVRAALREASSPEEAWQALGDGDGT